GIPRLSKQELHGSFEPELEDHLRGVAEQDLNEGHRPGELLLDVRIERLWPGADGNSVWDEHTPVVTRRQHQGIQMILRTGGLKAADRLDSRGAIGGVRANNEWRLVHTVEALLEGSLQDQLLLCGSASDPV